MSNFKVGLTIMIFAELLVITLPWMRRFIYWWSNNTWFKVTNLEKIIILIQFIVFCAVLVLERRVSIIEQYASFLLIGSGTTAIGAIEALYEIEREKKRK